MPRILIIEDDADSLLALAVRLRSSGFEVITAADGASAIAKTRQQKPDLIILDLGLPAGDGFVVMQRLRSMAHTAGVPIVVLTGRDPEGNKEKALAGGAVAFFQKPADNADLLATIRAHVRVEEGAATAPTKVLLVEDDMMTLQAMTIRLRHHGFEVVTATDAVTAMTTAVKVKPRVVLLDLGLPGGGGFPILERMRTHPDLASTPVIVITARADDAVREKALAAGARVFLTKPVEPKDLLEAIEGVLAPA